MAQGMVVCAKRCPREKPTHGNTEARSTGVRGECTNIDHIKRRRTGDWRHLMLGPPTAASIGYNVISTNDEIPFPAYPINIHNRFTFDCKRGGARGVCVCVFIPGKWFKKKAPRGARVLFLPPRSGYFLKN